MRGYDYRFKLGLHLDGYFPGKTPRYFSPSSPPTTHLTQLCNCHSNPMDLLLYCVVILFNLLSVFSVITNLQFFSRIIISLSTSLLATCISYCLIWRKQATRIIPNEVQARKDFNLNRTLLLISAIFVFSWLPFHVLNIVSTFCSSCEIFLVKVYVIKFLHYSNSFMNFLVYCFRMPHFRKALLQMLHKCRCSR